jgi:hypothetical protein
MSSAIDQGVEPMSLTSRTGPGLAILTILAASLLAACSAVAGAGAAPSVASLESNDPAAPSAAASGEADTDPQEAMLAYTECMREHGVDMPDPQLNGEGGAIRIGGPDSGVDPESEEFQEAQEACQGHLEGVRRDIDPEQRAELQSQMLADTECMREHGIDMPDPQFGEGGTVRIGGPGQGEEPRFDPESSEFQEAQEACADELGELRGPGSQRSDAGDD